MGGTIWLFSASFLWRKAPGLSFRGAKRRGNLAGPGWITGKFRQNRDCLPKIATAPPGPCNDKSGGLAPLNLCRNHCQPAWRSLSAATFFSRAAALYNERRCLPEIATAPSGPRNDNSGVLAILAAAGTNRSCSAGSGMPLPYNARLTALRNFSLSFFNFPFAACPAPAKYACFEKTRRAGWAARRAAGLTSGARGRGPGGSSRSGSP